MPEGDTIHLAANRIRPVLEGHVPDAVATPHPRFGADGWPERLAGRAVEAVTAHGKHLFVRFEGDLAIHSHLRMTGAWGVHPDGARWMRGGHRAWLVITRDATDVVQFDGPVLELLTESRRRFDRRLAQLGPDIVADAPFDEQRFLARLREDDPTRPIGDALLDQRTVAGIGNAWKVRACFATGIDPWRPTAAITDDEALAIVRWTRPRMQESARTGHKEGPTVYGRTGRPCPRCATPIASRGQGDDNRITYWCPGCQR